MNRFERVDWKHPTLPTGALSQRGPTFATGCSLATGRRYVDGREPLHF